MPNDVTLWQWIKFIFILFTLVLNTLNNEIWFIQKQNTSYYSQLVVVKLFKFFAYPKYISVTLLYSNYLRSGIPFRHSSKRFSNSNLWNICVCIQVLNNFVVLRHDSVLKTCFSKSRFYFKAKLQYFVGNCYMITHMNIS